ERRVVRPLGIAAAAAAAGAGSPTVLTGAVAPLPAVAAGRCRAAVLAGTRLARPAAPVVPAARITRPVAAVAAVAALACSARLIVEPEGKADSPASGIDVEHFHLHDVTGLHHLARVLHEPVRKRRDVHEPV